MPKYVRLKPFNPTIGHVKQRYHRNGRLWESNKGWAFVDDSMADDLASVTQHEYDQGYAPIAAFDICTASEKAAIDKRERDARYKRYMDEHKLPFYDGEVPVQYLAERPGSGDLTTKDFDQAGEAGPKAPPEPAPVKAGRKGK